MSPLTTEQARSFELQGASFTLPDFKSRPVSVEVLDALIPKITSYIETLQDKAKHDSVDKVESWLEAQLPVLEEIKLNFQTAVEAGSKIGVENEKAMDGQTFVTRLLTRLNGLNTKIKETKQKLHTELESSINKAAQDEALAQVANYPDVMRVLADPQKLKILNELLQSGSELIPELQLEVVRQLLGTTPDANFLTATPPVVEPVTPEPGLDTPGPLAPIQSFAPRTPSQVVVPVIPEPPVQTTDTAKVVQATAPIQPVTEKAMPDMAAANAQFDQLLADDEATDTPTDTLSDLDDADANIPKPPVKVGMVERGLRALDKLYYKVAPEKLKGPNPNAVSTARPVLGSRQGGTKAGGESVAQAPITPTGDVVVQHEDHEVSHTEPAPDEHGAPVEVTANKPFDLREALTNLGISLDLIDEVRKSADQLIASQAAFNMAADTIQKAAAQLQGGENSRLKPLIAAIISDKATSEQKAKAVAALEIYARRFAKKA